jgi:hypothetical protein
MEAGRYCTAVFFDHRLLTKFGMMASYTKLKTASRVAPCIARKERREYGANYAHLFQ